MFNMFQIVNPLIAFAIYFGVWHSIGSIADEIEFLKAHNNPLFVPINQQQQVQENLIKNNSNNQSKSVFDSTYSDNRSTTVGDFVTFYKLAAPYTIASVVGMILFLVIDPMKTVDRRPLSVSDKMSETTLWTIFIVSISVITGPHMWVMNLVAVYSFGLTELQQVDGSNDVDGENLIGENGNRNLMDPLGIENWAKDWIIGGGWWWLPRKNKD
ncbi:hypothetical protein HK100_009319 [Physocladia obscura]|uniref:Uncharacterized protein n=1 Tax=Physocladia obscura TaxID=109957 RepID=A0AAD5XJC7_9FUNG|nr:hypothetical protein HK100_009319 [Physocladia obscura]